MRDARPPRRRTGSGNRAVFDLEHFVTEAGLDGLFFTIAREQEKIRRDPVARTTALLKKFFGHGI